jgi:hypothetical protein
VSKTGIIAVVSLVATAVCAAQDPPPLTLDPGPVPVLSGYLAFVPTWDHSDPTLVSIFSPVVLVPLGRDVVFESRAAFEGDFQRRNGGSGDFTGAIQKSLDYAEIDYIGSRYVTLTAGRFLTPFNIFNERLYPNWIRNTQTDPLIFPIGTGSDNGAMLRGGVSIDKDLIWNYALYFSALSTADHFESERHTGVRASLFLPVERLEIGMSAQHVLEGSRRNRYGFHFEWQPARTAFELRSEAAYSREEGNGLWVEGAYRFRSSPSPEFSRAQVVARTQVFHSGTLPGSNPNLPATDMKRTEFGLNYYLTDGWKALASYGRSFRSAGDSNIWTAGMTYRFVIPLGPSQ